MSEDEYGLEPWEDLGLGDWAFYHKVLEAAVETAPTEAIQWAMR